MTFWRLLDENLNTRQVGLRWREIPLLLYLVQILIFHVACDTVGPCSPSDPVNVRVATVLSESVVQARLLAVYGDSRSNNDTGLTAAQFQVSRVFKGPKSTRLTVFTTDVLDSDLQCIRINASCLVFVNISTSILHTGVTNVSAAPGHLSRLTPRTRRAVRYVRMHICQSQYCIRRRPFVQLRQKLIRVNEGRQVIFTCEAHGMPLPVVFWTKDHVPLESSSHISLRMKRHASRLRIENALLNDTGSYRCFAVNGIGRSRLKRTRVIVSAVTSSCPANSRPCVDQSYCLNDGLCCDIDMLARKLCQCIYPYTGERCSRKLQDIDVFEMLDREVVARESYGSAAVVVIILVIIVMLAAAFLIVIIVFAIRIHHSRYRHHHKSKSGRPRGYRVDDAPHIPDCGWQFTVPQANIDTERQLVNDDLFEVQAVVENDDSKYHDCGTVQLDNRARPVDNSEHRHLSASPSDASISGSELSVDSHNAPVVSDVEAHCTSDADILDVDDDQCLSPPMSRCAMSGYGDGGDTSSWTQDDDSASSSGNELLRRLEAYTQGDDESVDEFVIGGVIPSLENFIAADTEDADTNGSPI